MDVIQLTGDSEAFWQRQQQQTEFELWDDNTKAYELFQQCQTQWNVSMSGITGLNYPALESVMRMSNISQSEQAALFEQVRYIENGYLSTTYEKLNRANK